MANHSEDFRTALAEHGLKYSGLIFGDGKLHRFKADEDSDAASWYVLYASDPKFAAGAFGCWRRQISEKWHTQNGGDLSPDEKKLLYQRIRDAEQSKKTEEEKRHAEAKLKAGQLLSGGTVPATHPYLERKKVGVHGEMRVSPEGLLLLPLRAPDGSLQSLQLIAPDKRFHGGRDKDFISGG